MMVTGPEGKPAWPVRRKYMITSWNSHSEVHPFLKVGGNHQHIQSVSLLCTEEWLFLFLLTCLNLVPGDQTAKINTSCPSKLRRAAFFIPLKAWLTSEDNVGATWPISYPTSAACYCSLLCPEASANSSIAAMLTAQELPAPLPALTCSVPTQQVRL
jgi:hypothetical protein